MKKEVIELFSGVGGFRLGLEDNDFEVVWGNQFEPSKKSQHAFNAYSQRFENKGIHSNEDISKVNLEDIPEHSILVGGFPCQDYSVAQSNAKGIEGKKGVLFWEIKRILEGKNTPFALLENVDRLLKSPTKQRGRDFLVMLHTFWELGYGVEWRVINAADYGLPQKRKRVFIFAFHSSTKYYQERLKMADDKVHIEKGFFGSQFEVDGYSEKHGDTHLELNEDVLQVSNEATMTIRNSGYMINGMVHSYEAIPKIVEDGVTLGELLESDVDEKYYLSEDQIAAWEYLKGSKSIPRTTSEGFTYTYSEGQMAFPDHLDKPARTMLTSEGSKNRSSHVVLDPQTQRLRILTPLECERINGFPDNWTKTEMPEKFRYFCMGNALVVGLIKKMGVELSQIVENE